MADRDYWLDLFTGKTWQEFLDAGSSVSGFRRSRWTTVQRIKKGDYLLCYLTGVSRWIVILEVTSSAFLDGPLIWSDEDFPARLEVMAVALLKPETAVPILQIRDRLSIFQNLASPNAWTGHVRGSPTRWKRSDGKAVVRAVLDAESSPVSRPVDPRKLARRPRAVKSEIGSVTVPDQSPAKESEDDLTASPLDHTAVQRTLLRLGKALGLDVWVARNDRTRMVGDGTTQSLPILIDELPIQFDEATTRTIEFIDVLWLRRNAIIAAFEIESTTSVYSGLLRMADLIAMQPNLNIPLYLVAPDERREKVFAEVNRPVFSRLSPPMSQMCRYIAFSELDEQIRKAEPFLSYLKPEFLEEISESCEVEEP